MLHLLMPYNHWFNSITRFLSAATMYQSMQISHLKWPYVPLQFSPFPSSWYPVSQLQMKLPIVLVQLCSQPPFAMLHSLMSVKQQGILRLWHGDYDTRDLWQLCRLNKQFSHPWCSVHFLPAMHTHTNYHITCIVLHPMKFWSSYKFY